MTGVEAWTFASAPVLVKNPTRETRMQVGL